MQVSDVEKVATFDLRGSWQVRALREAKGQAAMVLLSVLAHTYDDAMLVLFPLAFPNLEEPQPPCIMSAGKVAKTGAVVADVMGRDGLTSKDVPIYPTELALRDEFRRLADRMKLNDSDRVEMFKCVQRWVVADRRLDPSFDPQDPDAKRLVH